MSFIGELRRRNVLRVAAAYVVTAWLVVQVAETLFPIYGLSDGVVRVVVNLLAIGFLPALVLAWVFEWTPEGFRRDAGIDHDAPASVAATRRFDRGILVVLALALGYFAFDKFVLDPARDVEMTEAARQEGRGEAIIESYGDASIAVLAFADMSPELDQAYLSDGIAEEILHLLARIPELRVISRSSAFAFKGKDVSIPEIARQLNVGHVLEGSVRKAGDRIRVTAQLIDARADRHIWSETYDRTLDDIFAIQDELAAAMVDQLKITLLDDTPTAHRVDAEAYLLYLQGHHYVDLVDAELAVEYLEQAVAIEPDYVDALLDLGRAYFQLSGTNSTPPDVPKDEFWHRSNEVLTRAKSLDPDHPTVLAYDAWDAMESGDLATAARRLEDALEAHPYQLDVLRVGAIFSRLVNRYDIALALNRMALSRDPLCAACVYIQARLMLDLGRHTEVLEAIERYRSLAPESGGQVTAGLARLGLGDEAGALREFEIRAGEPDGWYGPLMVKATRGDDIAAELEAIASGIPEQAFFHFLIAELLAVSGDIDGAFRWLESGERLTIAMGLPRQSPYLENLHGDPRWTGFLERAGASPRQLEAIGFDPDLPDEFTGACDEPC